MWDKGIEKIRASVVGLGYEFVGAQCIGAGHQAILRIFVDAPNGITIEQITQISHQILGLIEVELPQFQNYRIEVSSPGLDRPLFTIADYQKFIGKKAKIHLKVPLEGRRHFAGKLVEVSDQEITIAMDDGNIALSFSSIEKGNLVPEISFKKSEKKDE